MRQPKFDYHIATSTLTKKEYLIKTKHENNRLFSHHEIAYMLSHLYPDCTGITEQQVSCVTAISEALAERNYSADNYTAPVYGPYGTFYQKPEQAT